MKPNNNKLSRINKSSVESPVSSAKKSKRSTKRKPATRNSPRATAAQSPDLSAQVAELQEQIAAIRKAIEQPQSSPSPVSAFRSQPSASSPTSSPVESSGYSTGPSHSPLNHAVVAQREGGPPPSPLDLGPSTLPAAKPLPVYELKETRPVGHQSLDLLASFSEETQDGFFTGLLDRARMQWLMGDWEGLVQINLEQIQHHPDRAKLALLGAMGFMNKGQSRNASRYLAFAKSQGCSSKLIGNVLLSGIHTTLYSANYLNGHEKRADQHQLELERLGLPHAKSLEIDRSISNQPPRLPNSENINIEIPLRIKVLSEQVANDSAPIQKSAFLLRTEDFSAREQFLFLFQIAKLFQLKGNKMVASSFLEEASQCVAAQKLEDFHWLIVKGFLDLGLPEEAFIKRLAMPDLTRNLKASESMALEKAGKNLLEKIFDFNGHGHELLISTAKIHSSVLKSECIARKPVLIEIGTTRESASGQGSTKRLADLCHREGFHFITVDMDSACTEMARHMFRQNNYSFEAIHSKGEDFLGSYSGPIDGIFLDAYDFDHGMHTELRQSRYEKFFGTRINEADCHKMHLDCVLEIIKKAYPWTLICLDDTWLHFGRWVAKGTQAVPCLIENGYSLLDVRNRAVLMGSSYWLQKIQTALPY